MSHFSRMICTASSGFRIRLMAIFLALVALPAAAQDTGDSLLEDSTFRQRAKAGLENLYNMNFETADSLFTMIAKDRPGHPIGPFMKALTTWWTILIDLQDESHDDVFYRQMEEVIGRATKILEKDPDDIDAMFLKGAALGFRGRLRGNRKQWFKAGYDGKRAMDYVLDVAERRPDIADLNFGKGVYDYYAAAIPEKYPVVKPLMWFFPSGDKERGLRELKTTVEDGFFIRTEAAYFLLQIYFSFEESYSKSLKYAKWLREHHPDNSYFHILEGRVYARWGRWRKAVPVFEEVAKRYRAGQTGYSDAIGAQALYYLGRYHMREGEYEEALAYLEDLRRIANDRKYQSYFTVYGRLREGMVLDAMERRQAAIARYEEVLDMENHGEAHKRARRYLEEPFPRIRG